jgi:NAD+ diphosphatase
VLPQDEGGLVAYACALVNWHRRHGFCAACGTATDVEAGGLVRACPRCGVHHFPRTDPVVIMVVHDGPERILLGRQPSWPESRYSTLAGFVEPGESLEEAVAREVREEASVEIDTPRYVSSQPWPFPASLMLGFSARHRAGVPRRQPDEIEDVRWFERAEVAAAVAGDGRLALPRPYAIARRLIEGWLAG